MIQPTPERAAESTALPYERTTTTLEQGYIRIYFPSLSDCARSDDSTVFVVARHSRRYIKGTVAAAHQNVTLKAVIKSQQFSLAYSTYFLTT